MHVPMSSLTQLEHRLTGVNAVSPGAIAGIVIVIIVVVAALLAVVGLMILYISMHYRKWKPSVVEVSLSK